MHAPVIGDITCARERPPVGATYVDFHPLFVAHGMEIRGRPVTPDVIRYNELDRLGMVAFFAARRHGVPIGYSCHLACQSMHYNLRFGHDDFWYVLPEFRGRGVGTTLRRMGLAWLRDEKKVAYVEDIMGHSLVNRKMMRNLGFYRQGVRWRLDFTPEAKGTYG